MEAIAEVFFVHFIQQNTQVQANVKRTSAFKRNTCIGAHETLKPLYALVHAKIIERTNAL